MAVITPLPLEERSRPTRQLFIRNLVLDAHIGVYAHERGRSQAVRINADLTVEDTPAADRLDQVVDYGALCAEIRQIAGAGHINLAETLAERIAEACLADTRVRVARVRVEKLAVLDGAESAGVEIERVRG